MDRFVARSAALGLVSILVAGALTGPGAPAGAVVPDPAVENAAVPSAPWGSGDALWTPSATPLTASRGGSPRTVEPSTFRAYTLNAAGLAGALAGAPLEGTRRATTMPVQLTVPAPTGELVTFSMVESPVLEAGIQARHPEIRTYAGTAVGFADSIRLDVTPAGLHAAVRGPGHGSWYVDPAFQVDTGTYVSYFGSALPPEERRRVEPRLSPAQQQKVIRGAESQRAGEGPGAVVVQRVYRLALLSDPTYAEALAPGLNDGTRDAASNKAVLAAKVTLINRVVQIYSDDLSIRFVLIDGSDRLNLNTAAKVSGGNGPCGTVSCFTTAQLASDGAGCTGELVNRQREVIGLLAGAENFDVGHFALGKSFGGIAGAGVGTSYKALGCTGWAPPIGDRFAVDYLAHELGHQFAAGHTFTSPIQCGYRAAESAAEPGSGSSIMSYAGGLCGSDNLQGHSDPYLSQMTHRQVYDYIDSGEEDVTEVQAVALSGFDGTESFTLSFGGDTTAPIKNGINYSIAGIQTAVQAATGASVTVSGLFGASFSTSGFELTYDGVDNEPDPILNVGSGHTGIANTIDEGGLTVKAGHTRITTTNHNPVVSGAPNKTIPIRTPFALTGSATDVDGDALSYLWEQSDLGGDTGVALIDNNKTSGALFRMFGIHAEVTHEDSLIYNSPGENAAGSSPTRVFPDLAQVLAGTTNAATGSCPKVSGTDSLPPGATLDCYSEFLPTSAYVGSSMAGNASPARLQLPTHGAGPEGRRRRYGVRRHHAHPVLGRTVRGHQSAEPGLLRGRSRAERDVGGQRHGYTGTGPARHDHVLDRWRRHVPDRAG